MTKTAEIFELVRELGTPSRLPPAWAPLPPDPALFDLPKDRAELVRRLQERFPRRELLRAGVVQTDSDNGVGLSDLLASNDSYLCALQKSGGKKPFDLLAGGSGTLLGQLPLTAALDDAEFLARVEREGGRLFLAESAADVAILRSLGWPVAPAHEVERLGGKRLDLLCAKMGLPVVGRRASDPDAVPPKSRRQRGQPTGPRIPWSLVLVNWRPSQLNLDDVPKMLEIRSHLLALAERLGIPLDDFAIWKPAVVQLACLRHALECGDPKLVRAAVRGGFEDDCVMLDRWPLADRTADSLAEAARNLSVSSTQVNCWNDSTPEQQFAEAVNRRIIEPLLAEADKAAEPLSGNLLLGIGGLSKMFQAKVWGPQANHQVRDLLALAKTVLAMSKEARKWT
jgi:hypothetical protein